MRLILTGDNAGRVVEDWLADEIGADTVDTVEAARIVREWNAEYVQTEIGVISPDMKRAWARSSQLEAEVARLKRRRLILAEWVRILVNNADDMAPLRKYWKDPFYYRCGAQWVAAKMGGR
jgi:hypothetical protein